MRAPTMLRKKASAHCTAVPVGARIARPRFVQNLLFAQLLNIKKMREGMTDSHLLLSSETEMNRTQQGTCKKAGIESGFTAVDCRQKAILPRRGENRIFRK